MSYNQIIVEDTRRMFNDLNQDQKAFFSKSSIMITGAAGFLGYTFLHFFCLKAKELNIKKIIALDNFMLRTPSWIEKLNNDFDILELKKFDVISDSFEQVAEAANVDVVIHMASIASPTFYRKYPIETIDANITGLRKLLDFYRDRNLKGLLFFSSSEIYGDPSPDAVPTDEEYRGLVSCTGPRACYDESKRFGETICMLYAQKYNMPITVARPFNNYGPGMDINDLRVPADFAKCALNNQDITILSDGTPKRTFCYVSDAVTGYLKVLASGKYDYFNIGIDKPEISVSELAEIYKKSIKDLNGTDINVVKQTSQDKDYLTHNPQRRCPKINKAKEKLDYNPKIHVDEGVSRFLKFLLIEQGMEK